MISNNKIVCDSCDKEYIYTDDQNFQCSYCGNMVHEPVKYDDEFIYDPNSWLLETGEEFDRQLYETAKASGGTVYNWDKQ